MTTDLKGKQIDCLDKGFVRLIDYMGSDNAIVQAARVSYGEGTKQVSQDRGLIRYLMRHSHTTPFEMVEFKFHVKLPIFVARQWIRHRMASVNEYSGRYSIMKDEFYVPDMDQIRPQSVVNKQGRSEDQLPEEQAQRVVEMFENSQREAYAGYEEMLGYDLAREIARNNLPLSLYTEWYWKIDLHNLFHFLRLRLDAHAQYEIRVYGEAIAELVQPIVPFAWQAFEDYTLHAKRFSRMELRALHAMLTMAGASPLSDDELKAQGLSVREIREFRDKLEGLENAYEAVAVPVEPDTQKPDVEPQETQG